MHAFPWFFSAGTVRELCGNCAGHGRELAGNACGYYGQQNCIHLGTPCFQSEFFSEEEYQQKPEMAVLMLVKSRQTFVSGDSVPHRQGWRLCVARPSMMELSISHDGAVKFRNNL